MSQFKPMGVRRRFKNVMLQYKFDRQARKAAHRRDAELSALIRKSR